MLSFIRFSLIAEAVTLAATFLCFRLVAYYWGAAGLSEWILLRRVVAYVLPVITFGYEVALPRFVAISLAANDTASSSAHLWASAAHVTVVLVVAVVAASMAPDAIAELLFGSARFNHLSVPLALLCAGLALAQLSYSKMRGEMRIRWAGMLHFTVNGGIPVVLFLLALPTVAFSANAIGTACLLVGGSALWWQLQRQIPDRRQALQSLRTLAHYGVTRMLSALGLMLLLALPVIHLANATDTAAAAYIGFALSILVTCGSLMTPVGVVLLPHLAAQGARKSLVGIRERLFALECGLLVGSLVAALAAPIWGRWLASFILLDDVSAFGPHLTTIGFLVGPYMYFVLMRQVIDAATTKAINLLNVSLSLTAYLLMLGLLGLGFFEFERSYVVVSAFAAAVVTLAVGTGISVRIVGGGRDKT